MPSARSQAWHATFCATSESPSPLPSDRHRFRAPTCSLRRTKSVRKRTLHRDRESVVVAVVLVSPPAHMPKFGYGASPVTGSTTFTSDSVSKWRLCSPHTKLFPQNPPAAPVAPRAPTVRHTYLSAGGHHRAAKRYPWCFQERINRIAQSRNRLIRQRIGEDFVTDRKVLIIQLAIFVVNPKADSNHRPPSLTRRPGKGDAGSRSP